MNFKNKVDLEQAKQATPFAVFGILILVLLFGLHAHRPAKPSLHAGDAAPVTDLPVLNDDGARFRTKEWRGRPYVVNFFASWCPDCRAEHEELMTLEATKIPVIGVMFKDRVDKVSTWLDHSGDPYLFVAQDEEGATEALWQLAGVPETFVVDAHGVIRWHYAGILTNRIVTHELMPVWESVAADSAIR